MFLVLLKALLCRVFIGFVVGLYGYYKILLRVKRKKTGLTKVPFEEEYVLFFLGFWKANPLFLWGLVVF